MIEERYVECSCGGRAIFLSYPPGELKRLRVEFASHHAKGRCRVLSPEQRAVAVAKRRSRGSQRDRRPS